MFLVYSGACHDNGYRLWYLAPGMPLPTLRRLSPSTSPGFIDSFLNLSAVHKI